MQIDKSRIEEHNHKGLAAHRIKIDQAITEIPGAEQVIKKLIDFQIAIPSWALGTGGTRFGRFA